MKTVPNLIDISKIDQNAFICRAEKEIFIRTLIGETLEDPNYEDMLAIGAVILNRAANPKWWGKDIITVCQKPWQFSCWNRSSELYWQTQTHKTDTEQWMLAEKVFKKYYDFPCEDITYGATHFKPIMFTEEPETKVTLTTSNFRFYRYV